MTSTILFQVAVMLLLVLTGWVLSKRGKLPDEKTLGGLLTNASLPAMIISSTMNVPVSSELLADMGLVAVGFVGVMALGVGMGFIAAKLARQSTAIAATWAVCVGFPNVVFIGWPFKYAVYGGDSLPLLSVIALVFNIILFTVAGRLLSLGSTNRIRPSLKQLLLQPVIISGIIGLFLLLTPITLPGPVQTSVGMLAATTIPLAMIFMGNQLSRCSLRDTFLDRRAYIASFVRLVPVGLVSYFMLSLFIPNEMVVGFLFIGAVTPTATSVPIIAAQQGVDAVFCSKVCVLSTILSALTIPLLIPLLI